MDTLAKRSIKHCLDMLAPFEPSEASLEEGQRQFYRLMVSIWQGMYENPEKYLVFPDPYEKYMGSRRMRAARRKEKEHVSDSRESTLRNTIQQAIPFYAAFFFEAGLASTEPDQPSGGMIIPQREYALVLERMNRFHGAEHHAGRYERLAECGVSIREKDGMVYIAHETLRQAMDGALYLCRAPESKYKWMNFLRLDFKNAYAPAPAVADICRTLPAERAALVRELEAQLSGMRVKARIKPLRGIVSDFKWKVEYACQGKNICGFYADNSYFMLCIYFNSHENINRLAALLYGEDRALFEWFRDQFPERLCACPNNRRVFFGQEPRRICGLSNRAEIVSPDREDVERAMYVMKRFRGLEGNENGSYTGRKR